MNGLKEKVELAQEVAEKHSQELERMNEPSLKGEVAKYEDTFARRSTQGNATLQLGVTISLQQQLKNAGGMFIGVTVARSVKIK
ncbi:hypothetical protein FRC02_002200 [Tulasnella sp. 418]|nr:hypothetical protein FRC02_002200 [Tulasnella sp. 418]